MYRWVRDVRCFVADGARISHSLALGEVLLDEVEREGAVLRIHLWRPAEWGVVLGSACRISQEVFSEACRERGVSIARRVTGGGAVVVGPVTWCYTFAWSRSLEPGTIEGAFRQVCNVIIEALRGLGLEAIGVPISDLAVSVPGRGLCKIAGHGQKRRRNGTACGGSLLAAPFPFAVGELLKHPPREPPYREGRSHDEFLTCLELQGIVVSFGEFVEAVLRVLGIPEATALEPHLRIAAERLARAKYEDPAWTERL